jgi:Ca-activated chloride channel family protein
MRFLFAFFVTMGGVYGTPLDYYYLYKANSFEKGKQYTEALHSYKQIHNKSDAVRYNMGNLYYKKKSYQKAIESYLGIKSNNLQYQTLHNLGNSYAKINEIDKAIMRYEKALTIKKDKDTLYNLELLKKMKNEKQKEQQQETTQKNEDNNDTNQEENQKDTNKGKSEGKNGEVAGEKQKQNDDKIKKDKVQNQIRKAGELSDLEEKKWSQILENRDIKTLLVPISNGGEKNEHNIKPW